MLHTLSTAKSFVLSAVTLFALLLLHSYIPTLSAEAVEQSWEPGGPADLPPEPMPDIGYTEEAITCIQDCVTDNMGIGPVSRPNACACDCLEKHDISFREKFCDKRTLFDESNIRTIDMPFMKGGLENN